MGLLENKVALITGSGSGIGQGIARAFAEEGAKVVVNYIGGPEGAEHTLALVREAGSDGILVQADITDLAQMTHLMDEAHARFGTVDILVNNAGVETKEQFTEVTERNYDHVMAVNLRAPFFLTQCFVQKLVAAKRGGRVINISSVHEDMAFPGFSTYCVSKGGLRMLMRNLAVELGPLGITINNIAPGAIETPINKQMMAQPEVLAALLRNIPAGRLGTIGDVGQLAAFLASDKAEYITGSTYVIDGGLMRSYHEQ